VNIAGGVSKAVVEIPVELMAAGDAAKMGRPGPNPVGGPMPPNGPPAPGAPPAAPPAAEGPTKPEDLPGWTELGGASRLNEAVPRLMIHEKLAAAGKAQPADVMKWLYKDVLHADLDDPTLGIGELLDKRYPFAAEDAATKRK